MSDFVLAIDQGTTGTKLHRLYTDGRFQTLDGFEHRQILPQPGWVEHDPEELIRHLDTCIGSAGNAKAIGIANQGETVVAWDARTKRPIYNAIVWQDARTNDVIDRLKQAGHEETTLARAGLPLDPYFSASKLRWFLDHVDDAKLLLKQGRLRLGTSDSFFLDRLAGVFATDVTTASRTSLMNLETLQWDPVLCDLFGVPIECLAEIRATADDFGAIGKTPLTANVVDQQAALFGHGCRQAGDAKITFGTGAFALCVTGAKPLRDVASGLLPTIAWRLGDERPRLMRSMAAFTTRPPRSTGRAASVSLPTMPRSMRFAADQRHLARSRLRTGLERIGLPLLGPLGGRPVAGPRPRHRQGRHDAGAARRRRLARWRSHPGHGAPGAHRRPHLDRWRPRQEQLFRPASSPMCWIAKS